MLDMLSIQQKKWLVDNRKVLTNQASAIAVSTVAAMVGTFCTVCFNQHNYEIKRVVRNDPHEDFVVFEDITAETELRDSLRPDARERELEELKEMFGHPEEQVKPKKKKKKSKERGVVIK